MDSKKKSKWDYYRSFSFISEVCNDMNYICRAISMYDICELTWGILPWDLSRPIYHTFVSVQTTRDVGSILEKYKILFYPYLLSHNNEHGSLAVCAHSIAHTRPYHLDSRALNSVNFKMRTTNLFPSDLSHWSTRTKGSFGSSAVQWHMIARLKKEWGRNGITPAGTFKVWASADSWLGDGHHC